MGLSEYLQSRVCMPMSATLVAEIGAHVAEAMRLSSDTRLKEVLRNFGWTEQGFPNGLDIEGLCVAVRRSQISTSFLRASILHNTDNTSCFVPEILMSHLTDLLDNQEFGIRPFSRFIFGACLLVDISGFTKLSSQFCARGADGIDDLQKQINGYLGELAAIIYAFGGDILKYAGDAVLCLFPSSGPGDALQASRDGQDHALEAQQRADCCQLAIFCAMNLKEMYTADLSVHVAVTCGQVCFGVLGGFNDRFETLISGPCLMDLSQCLDDAKSKEVVLSEELCNQLNEVDLTRYETRKLDSGNYLLLGLTDPTVSAEQFKASHPIEATVKCPIFTSFVAQFVPEPINQQLYTGDLNQLGELREVTTVFVKWQSYDCTVHKDLLSLQDLFYGCQEIIAEQGGFIRQFLVDDKGCVLIALWGVPSASHIDNAFRAVTASSALQSIFHRAGQEVAVGITTGKVFTGTVGSPLRKEYAAIGDSVNMAARLMSKANGEIYLDYTTASKLSKSYHDRLRSMGKFAMKGKSEPMEVYSYIVANATKAISSRMFVGNSFSHIRPQVLNALKAALDGILAMLDEASMQERSGKERTSATVPKTNRPPRSRESLTVTKEAPSFSFMTAFQPTKVQHMDDCEMSGLGYMILLEGKTEFEKMNIIQWLKKEANECNFQIKEIELVEEDRQYPLELWRKLFREVIGSEICDDIDQLECYFFPLLKDLEPDDALFVDEIAIPILCALFRIHNATLNHTDPNQSTMQYRGLQLHHLPNRMITTLIQDCFDRVMANQVRTIFIIHNLQFAAELSLKIFLQTQEHPVFHIFFTTSSLSSLSMFRVESDDSDESRSKSENDFELPRWIRNLCARIANVDIITLGAYSVDDIKLMLTSIATISNPMASPLAPDGKRYVSYRAELANLIHQLSDGNAFWVEEFVGFIAEAGVDSFMKTMRKGTRQAVTRRNSNKTPRTPTAPVVETVTVTPNTSGSLGIPKLLIDNSSSNMELDDYTFSLSTLEAFVVCRFERLPPDVQKVLRVASILGFRFSRHVLYGVLRRKQRNNMFTALQQLVETKWITKLNTDMTTSTTDYKFNHPLLQSTLYQLTPATDRRDLHRKASKCLLEVYGKDEPRIYRHLIEHCAEYDQADALEYTIKFIDHQLKAENGYSIQILRYLELAVSFASNRRAIETVGKMIESAAAMIKVSLLRSRPPLRLVDMASRRSKSFYASKRNLDRAASTVHRSNSMAPPPPPSFCAKWFGCMASKAKRQVRPDRPGSMLDVKGSVEMGGSFSDSVYGGSARYGHNGSKLLTLDGDDLLDSLADVEYRYRKKKEEIIAANVIPEVEEMEGTINHVPTFGA